MRRADRRPDVTTGIVVLEAIERVNRELGTTTAVITHNAAIADMADRVISLADGHIVQRAPQRTPRGGRGPAAGRPMTCARCTASCCATSCRCASQAIAIALVLAAGVAMYVAYYSTFDSLQRTRAAYYGDYRFADVFANAKRAPLSLPSRIREIDGVAQADAARRRRRHARLARRDRADDRPPDLDGLSAAAGR